MKIKSSELRELIKEAVREFIKECSTCGCGEAVRVKKESKEVPGDEAELKTMDTANLEEEEEETLKEMSDSGAVFSDGPTIRTPGWVSRKSYGSPGALAATEKLGYTKADNPKKNKK